MLSTVLLVLLAQAVVPERLTPTGIWELDERGCVLSRKFQSGAGPVTFGIKPFIGAPGGELVLVLPGSGSGRYEVDEGRIVLGDGVQSFPAVWSRVGRRDQPFNGVTIQPDNMLWNALSSTNALTMDVGKRQQVRLELGPMKPAIAALESCRADKMPRVTAARRR